MYKKIRHKTSNKIYSIKLDDEIPRLGSGNRHVELMTLGRKWVKLRTYLGNPKKVDSRLIDNYRIKKSVWEGFKKELLN